MSAAMRDARVYYGSRKTAFTASHVRGLLSPGHSTFYTFRSKIEVGALFTRPLPQR